MCQESNMAYFGLILVKPRFLHYGNYRARHILASLERAFHFQHARQNPVVSNT